MFKKKIDFGSAQHMTDPKNSSKWKKEKNCRNQYKAHILKERTACDSREEWDAMCREKATSSQREEAVYWHFRHNKVEGESRFNQLA